TASPMESSLQAVLPRVAFAANSDVRFGSLADLRSVMRDVRFSPKSRHAHRRHQFLLSANSGHQAPNHRHADFLIVEPALIYFQRREGCWCEYLVADACNYGPIALAVVAHMHYLVLCSSARTCRGEAPGHHTLSVLLGI